VLNVKAGDAVTAGQVLAQIDPADAQSAVDDAQTNVTNAEQSLADAKTAASAAASPTPSATSGHGSSQPSGGTGGGSGGSGGGSNSGSNSGSGGGNTQRASTGTDAIYSATVQLNNAKLALLQAQRKLAGCTITAPIAGTVLTVSGAVGATENPGGTAFISVGSVADTQVKAAFSEADVARIAVGQHEHVRLGRLAAWHVAVAAALQQQWMDLPGKIHLSASARRPLGLYTQFDLGQ
jgi:HlyD family secretion protein